MASGAQVTVDHDIIKKWIEDRGGHPSVVRATEGKRSPKSKTGGGLLRIEFRDPADALEDIDWDEFFQVFDSNNLALLHYDKRRDGQISRFSRFLYRDSEAAQAKADESMTAPKKRAPAKKAADKPKAEAKPKATAKPKAATKPKAAAKPKK